MVRGTFRFITSSVQSHTILNQCSIMFVSIRCSMCLALIWAEWEDAQRGSQRRQQPRSCQLSLPHSGPGHPVRQQSHAPVHGGLPLPSIVDGAREIGSLDRHGTIRHPAARDIAISLAADPAADGVLARLAGISIEQWRQRQAQLVGKRVDVWMRERADVVAERRARLEREKQREQQQQQRSQQQRPHPQRSDAHRRAERVVGNRKDEERSRSHGVSALGVIVCTIVLLWGLLGVTVALHTSGLVTGAPALVPVLFGSCACSVFYPLLARTRGCKEALQGDLRDGYTGREGCVLTTCCVWLCSALVIGGGIVAFMAAPSYGSAGGGGLVTLGDLVSNTTLVDDDDFATATGRVASR